MKNTMYNNIEPHQDSLEETKPAENILSGEWMTVTEMGKLLGLQRTERYWLVHKNLFETKMILGKMRLVLATDQIPQDNRRRARPKSKRSLLLSAGHFRAARDQ